MPIVAKSSGDFTPAPEGSHLAVCTKVIDMGLQEGQYGLKHAVMLTWELDEEMDDGRPFVISRRYNLTLGKRSTLRRDLEAWRGKTFSEKELEGFDVSKLLGVGCIVSVVHSVNEGTTYSNVAGLAKLPKGTKAPAPYDAEEVYVVEGPQTPAFKKLSDRMQEMVAEGHARMKDSIPVAPSLVEELDDDIPF